MPELPEVEAIRQDLLNLSLKGKEVEKVTAYNPRTLDPVDSRDWDTFFKNPRLILSIERKGKWLLFKLKGGVLFIHLRMSGKLRIAEGKSPSKHERARIFVRGGKALSFIDPRKFGRIILSLNEDAAPDVGIDPTEEGFREEVLSKLALESSVPIKTLLLDQKKISGLGNIYVDEALFKAGIHPASPSNTLSPQQLRRLYSAIKETIGEAIKNRGTSLGLTNQNYAGLHQNPGSHQHQLYVYSRDGKPCRKCSTPIVKMRFRGRGTHYCPSCQKPHC